MIKRNGEWEEEQLAKFVQDRGYIDLYARKGDRVVYVPYKDLPTKTVKHIKFVYLNNQWIYVDNSQFSGF